MDQSSSSDRDRQYHTVMRLNHLTVAVMLWPAIWLLLRDWWSVLGIFLLVMAVVGWFHTKYILIERKSPSEARADWERLMKRKP